MNIGKKIAVIGSLALASVIASIPINRAYQKSSARHLLRQTENKFQALESRIKKAELLVNNNSFLFADKREEETLRRTIEEAKSSSYGISNSLSGNFRLLNTGDYSFVRSNLDSSFGLPKGQTREAPLAIIQYNADNIENVVSLCNNLRKSRDSVIANEFYLKARLRKPLASALGESPEDLSGMPLKYLSLIPTLSPFLKSGLENLPLELNNSLGANLIKHLPALDHILERGKNQRVKEKAQNFYDDAMHSYKKVKTLNDALVWYVSKKHDGTFSQPDYNTLAEKQTQAIDIMHSGDNSLKELDSFNSLLHEQKIEEVISHTSKKGKHYNFFDDKWVNHTDYYYTVQTSTPNNSSSKSIYAGRTKGLWSLLGWSYRSNEEIGWIIEYKPLHDDKTYSGWKTQLKPEIVRED